MKPLFNISLPTLSDAQLDAVKVMAVVLMVVDHIDFYFFGRSILWMTVLGRGAFPLFCYALAVAMTRIPPAETLSYVFKKYLPRLLLAAAVAEPISRYTRDAGELNVLFTLLFGAIFAAALLRLWPCMQQLALWGMAAGTLVPPFCEFGLPGMALPAMILLWLRGNRRILPAGLVLLYLCNVAPVLHGRGLGDPAFFDSTAFEAGIVFGIGGFVASAAALQLACGFFTGPRFLHKYTLYIFYPAHLAVLWALSRIF